MPLPRNTIPNDFTLINVSEESVEKFKKNDPRKIKGSKASSTPVWRGYQSVCGICGEKSRAYPNKKAFKLWDRLHIKGKHPDYL